MADRTSVFSNICLVLSWNSRCHRQPSICILLAWIHHSVFWWLIGSNRLPPLPLSLSPEPGVSKAAQWSLWRVCLLCGTTLGLTAPCTQPPLHSHNNCGCFPDPRGVQRTKKAAQTSRIKSHHEHQWASVSVGTFCPHLLTRSKTRNHWYQEPKVCPPASESD